MANRRQIAIDVVLWIFALFLAWIFIRQGASKFSNTSGWARAFQALALSGRFRLVVGVMETAAAVLLLTRRTALLGALIIIVVMFGAMGTHIDRGRPQQVTSELLPLVLATLVAIGRRKSFFLKRSGAQA